MILVEKIQWQNELNLIPVAFTGVRGSALHDGSRPTAESMCVCVRAPETTVKRFGRRSGARKSGKSITM